MSVGLGMPAAPVPTLAPRRKTRQLNVGGVGVGSDSPISVQSMCTTKTHDVNATLQQIAELTASGCEIVRVAVFDEAAAADAVDAGVGRHARQPSGNAGAARLPAPGKLPQPQQCFLRHIFGLSGIGEHAIGNAPGDVGIAIRKQPQGI